MQKKLSVPPLIGSLTQILQDFFFFFFLTTQTWISCFGFTFHTCKCSSSAFVLFPGLISPEGLAIDHFRRTMYWTDSGLDKIERAKLDGSERKALFHTELVNPRAIAVDPIRGSARLP